MIMTKSQIISAIQQLNPTAQCEWLESFDPASLRDYLDHLQLTLEPRGPNSRWIRRGDGPAVVHR